MREMWDAAQAGDLERAREIDAGLQPLYEAIGVTTNPIPVKAALEMAGPDPVRHAAAADGPGSTQAQRAVVREALETRRPQPVTPPSDWPASFACCRSAGWARSART